VSGFGWALLWFLAWIGLTSAITEMICLVMRWEDEPHYNRTFFYVGFGLVGATVWFST
jgi:hypothetical protein